MPVHVEAHQPPGPKPTEAATDEGVQSVRADPSAAAPGALSPDVPTTSAQQAKEDDVILVIGSGTQLHAYSLEFTGLMRSWSGLLNQAYIFDGQLMVSLVLYCFLCVDIF